MRRCIQVSCSVLAGLVCAGVSASSAAEPIYETVPQGRFLRYELALEKATEDGKAIHLVLHTVGGNPVTLFVPPPEGNVYGALMAADFSGLRIRDRRLTGTVVLDHNSSGRAQDWWPRVRFAIDVRVGDAGSLSGTYSGATRGRRGPVEVKGGVSGETLDEAVMRRAHSLPAGTSWPARAPRSGAKGWQSGAGMRSPSVGAHHGALSFSLCSAYTVPRRRLDVLSFGVCGCKLCAVSVTHWSASRRVFKGKKVTSRTAP